MTKRLAVLLVALSAGCAHESASLRPDPSGPVRSGQDEAETPSPGGASESGTPSSAPAPSGMEHAESEPGQALDTTTLRYRSGGAGPPAPSEAEPEPFSAAGVPIRGWLSSSVRYRGNGDTSDLDLYATLALDVADAEKDAVTGHVLVYGSGDLDGQPSNPADDAVFFDVNDTYDSSVVGRLYDAYVDVHAIDALDVVRAGRQQDYETPVLAWFDGLRLASKEFTDQHLQLGGFAGAPVRIYETTHGVTDGLFAQVKPWRGGRLRVDYMHFEEEKPDGLQKDDVYGIRGWQGFDNGLSLAAGHTRLGSDPRDWNARADWYGAKSDLRLSAAYYELLRPQGDLALEIDPFYETLFELFPYRQASFLASKGFGKHFRLEGGADVRRVSDQDDVGENNRDFDRYHVTTSFLDLPAKLDLGLTGELYDASGSDLAAWGADLGRRFGERWEASLGTYFALYQYDRVLDAEREHVRTYFVRTRFRESKSLAFELRAEYEHDDFDELDDVFVLRVGTTWSF